VCAAIEVARRLGSSKRIVTVVPDTGRNYLSTYFDSEWRRARDL
jgi:cysteine synthase